MSETVSIRDIFVPELGKAVERKDGYIMGGKGQNPRTLATSVIGFRSAFVNLPTA